LEAVEAEFDAFDFMRALVASYWRANIAEKFRGRRPFVTERAGPVAIAAVFSG